MYRCWNSTRSFMIFKLNCFCNSKTTPSFLRNENKCTSAQAFKWWNWQDTPILQFIKMGLTQSLHQSEKGDVLWTGCCKVHLQNPFHDQAPPRQSSVLSCDMRAHYCEDVPTVKLSKLLTTLDRHLL